MVRLLQLRQGLLDVRVLKFDLVFESANLVPVSFELALQLEILRISSSQSRALASAKSPSKFTSLNDSSKTTVDEEAEEVRGKCVTQNVLFSSVWLRSKSSTTVVSAVWSCCCVVTGFSSDFLRLLKPSRLFVRHSLSRLKSSCLPMANRSDSS